MFAQQASWRLRLFLAGLLFLNLALLGFLSFGSASPVLTRAAGPIKVLFDNTHAETAGNADWIISTSQPNPLNQNSNPQVESDWTGAISAWGVALQKSGRYSLSTLGSGGRITYGDTTNALDLTNFNEFVLPEPNIVFTSAEKTAIMRFVQNGGGLFMVSDHDQSDRNNDGIDSVGIFNDLMSNNSVNSNNPFGITIDKLNIANENPSNIPASAATNPVINGPFGKVTGSIIRNGTTATISPVANSNVKGLLYRNSFSNTGTTGIFFATSTFGSGRVAFWGDSSTIDDGTGQPGNNLFNGWDDPAGTDAALALNATEWLGGGSTSPGPTPTPTPTTTPTPSQQLIANGGFETGTSYNWTSSSSGGYALVDTTRPHTGTYGVYLCGYNNCTDSIYQTITIPANSTAATLTYYTYISTQETSHSYDFLKVQIRDTSNTVLATLQTLSDGSPTGSWRQSTYDLTSYKGLTIRVYFLATNDSSYPTDFFLDDVSVTTR